MRTGLITLTTELTEGSCNACGPVRSEHYTLDLNGQESLLSGFHLAGLVMAVVQQAGWRQEFKVEIIDEYFLFSREGLEVKLMEDFNEVTYSRGGQSLTSPNEFTDKDALFAAVNRVLSELFDIEPIVFALSVD